MTASNRDVPLPSWEWRNPPPEKLSRQARYFVPTVTRPMRLLADHLGTSRLTAYAARSLFDVIGQGKRPSGTTIESVQRCRVPVRIYTTPRSRARTHSAILYVHGGGFVFGSPYSHGTLVSWLSHHSGLPVHFPVYRRAPEHNYPAARDDVLATYRDLLDQGIPATRIAIAADSAGSHVVGSALLELARQGDPLPGAAAFFSPMMGLNPEKLIAADRARRDPLASPAYMGRATRAYLGSKPTTDSDVDVLGADLRRWPPVLVQVGATECMQVDANHLTERLTASGVPAALQVWPGQVHVFQAFAGVLPEGRLALKEAGAFLAAHLLDQA